MRFKIRTILCLAFVSMVSAQGQNKFTNPLLPSGADPWSIYKNGYYYYMHTLQDSLVIWKTKNLAALKKAERKTIWIPQPGTMYSKELWAPEIHFLKGKWYVYFAADDGKNNTHRLYVLENNSIDPMKGNWIFKGKIAEPSDKWAIDGSVFEHNGELFLVWSGWEGDINGRQDLYIGRMKNPWTIDGNRVRISSPNLSWEKNGDLHDSVNPSHVDVNEGPQILKRKDKLFLVYSASGCWTDQYTLGMLSISVKNDLLDSISWKKYPDPVFRQSIANGVYAPGHNSFFKSPDGKEDWILYHANRKPGQGCGKYRCPRAQKFYWKVDGRPYFGVPVKAGIPFLIPSENKKSENKITPKARLSH